MNKIIFFKLPVVMYLIFTLNSCKKNNVDTADTVPVITPPTADTRLLFQGTKRYILLQEVFHTLQMINLADQFLM